MIIKTKCPFCKAVTELEVPNDGYKAWRQGMLVQKAFPDLSVDDRERLISGTCPKCWEETF
jgi:phage FluMu protein Com